MIRQLSGMELVERPAVVWIDGAPPSADDEVARALTGALERLFPVAATWER